MKIAIDILGPAVLQPGADTEVEFSSLYGIDTALALSRLGHTVYVSADSANSVRATRHNSRHVNLVLLCQTSFEDCGAIIIRSGSKINRTRATKAAAMLSSELGYPFKVRVTAPGDDTFTTLRPYKAFAWVVKPKCEISPFIIGKALVNALYYSYDFQRKSARCAG